MRQPAKRVGVDMGEAAGACAGGEAEAVAEVEVIVDLGDRLLDLSEVRCVRFRPGFEPGRATPAMWADIEFVSGAVKSVFGPPARRLKSVLYQDGINIQVLSVQSR